MIYILEDDESIRKLVVYGLESQGFTVEGFALPSAFHRAMERALPELVLLDLMLPEEDGLHILRDLRASAATRTLPVILLTVLLAVALLAFRTGTFFFALRYGLAALAWLKRLGLINWTGRIKVVNACLLTVAAAMLLPYSGDRHTLLWCMGGGAAVLAAAWIIGRLHLPRIVLWLILLTFLVLMDTGLVGL